MVWYLLLSVYEFFQVTCCYIKKGAEFLRLYITIVTIIPIRSPKVINYWLLLKGFYKNTTFATSIKHYNGR